MGFVLPIYPTIYSNISTTSFFSIHPVKNPSWGFKPLHKAYKYKGNFHICTKSTSHKARNELNPNTDLPEGLGLEEPPPENKKEGSNLQTLINRFWKVAIPYWTSEDKVQARLQLAGVFALTLATTGISVGFNFLGRDFYNALANKDQEQFTKQLLYYLGAFAGGIPVSILLHPCRSLY